jgi:hypothetical protein
MQDLTPKFVTGKRLRSNELSKGSIYVTTMTDLDDNYDDFIVADFVNYTIVPLSYSIMIIAGKLLTTWWSRVL